MQKVPTRTVQARPVLCGYTGVSRLVSVGERGAIGYLLPTAFLQIFMHEESLVQKHKAGSILPNM